LANFRSGLIDFENLSWGLKILLILKDLLCDTPRMARRRETAGRGTKRPVPPTGSMSLKGLAGYLKLSPATVSMVLNKSRTADSIPQKTKARIFAAARKFNYRPNYLARSLRVQRSYTIGVVVPEVSEGYEALVLSGIEDHLLQEGYFYFLASHRHRPDLIDEYPRLLLERSVEGLIAVDTPCRTHLPVPVVAVSGHGDAEGVTNIELDHQHAATQGLEHLYQLGHRQIAFIKGQSFSSDTEVRWQAIVAAAARMGLGVNPKLVAQLEGDSPSPEPGYIATRTILGAHEPFTALFAFNDVSAIGAIRALREAGRRVPQDVSVIGFDDIQSAAFQNPALTTIRQPLRRMGELAAQTLVRRIANADHSANPKRLTVEPELVVRDSTCRVHDTS
jgi:LacI family transcriptional regulator